MNVVASEIKARSVRPYVRKRKAFGSVPFGSLAQVGRLRLVREAFTRLDPSGSLTLRASCAETRNQLGGPGGDEQSPWPFRKGSTSFSRICGLSHTLAAFGFSCKWVLRAILR